MLNKNMKPTTLSSPIKFKSRRTSLNVNLSYTSNTSLLTDDHENISSSIISDNDKSVDDGNFEKTIIDRTNLPVRRNLSLKGFTSSGKQKSLTSKSDNMTRIKPSFVRMVRIRTSTPLKIRNEKSTDDRISEETFEPSENLKRSRILEDVRFPLDGEIFSAEASIVMETSMDMTEVQGAAVLNSDSVVTEMVNVFSGVDRRDNSSLVVQDTEDMGYQTEERMETAIIPDSEQDSVDTIRTSLNVNTSLDSRLSSIPNNSLYDPIKNRDSQFERDIIPGNKLDGILSYPVSESSDGTVPINSCILTTAIIEHENLSNDANNQEIRGQETTIHLEPDRQSLHPSLHNSLLYAKNDKTDDKKIPPNDSGSSNASSLMNQEDESDHLRISNNEDDILGSIIPGDLAKNPIRRRKKQLLKLRRSEMVDLSPISVKMVPDKQPVPKKRGKRRNKTAKKVERTEDNVAKKLVPIYTSDDDIEEVDDIEPKKKEKRVRKVKTKKIVIKKMADVNLWKRLNDNLDITNESCDDISSTLGRTSLNDFEPKNNFVRHKNRKIRPKIIIVATGLPIEQKSLVKSTVTKLGSAKLDKIVTRNTTHVVGRGTRTVNLLRGLVRGCWLVSFEWISKSCEAGEWVDPEEYEITSFSKAVQENRKEKQLFGAAYVSELFLTCGSIHIKEETSTPAPVLKELVRIAGGRVATEPEEAKIIIGRGGFKEIWILDSITNGVIQPLDQYCKKKSLNQE